MTPVAFHGRDGLDKSLGVHRPTRRTWLAGAAALLLAGRADAAAEAAQAWREIERLRKRARVLLRRLGAWRGDVALDIARFMEAPGALYPDDQAGRATAVADMARRLEAARPLVAPAFDAPLPSATFRSLTLEEEQARRGGHRTADGYVVDLTAIRTRPAWTLPSVVFHETVPGHLLHAQVLGKAAPAAASEAWATYAEQLAAELGVYRRDPAGELGYIHWRLFRMARIVVDLGLNQGTFTDAQAVVALREIQGAPIAFASFETDVSRMRQSPGAYAAQGLGALELRRRRPGSRRAWPQFHAAALRMTVY